LYLGNENVEENVEEKNEAQRDFNALYTRELIQSA
jgi:hypothetical protein